MKRIQSLVDLKCLAQSVKSLEYWLDGANVQMCITQSGGLPPEIMNHEPIAKAVNEIVKVRKLNPINLMINKLDPQVIVPVHRDWIKGTPLQPYQPKIERWHLPIETNEGATFWGEDEGVIYMAPGYWYGPVQYWRKHNIANVGEKIRIHLIVDLDCPIPLGKYEEEQ